MLQNSNAIEDGGYAIDRSLRFSSASSQYLTRTPPAGNRTAWTVSLWIKRGKLGTRQDLFGVNNSNGLVLDISGGTDKLQFQVYNGAGADYYILTSNALRDPSAWYHIVAVWDSNNATAADRLRLYINGSRASGTTGNTIPLGALSTLNSATELNFGRNPQGGFYFEGYIADPRFIDGQALDATSFGEISTATGQWVAKRYIGAYGTNGSYLDFKDGTSTTTLGNDKSGNGNNWTLTNFTRSAGVNDCWMLDVPSGNSSAIAVHPVGNYAVLNNLFPLVSGFTISKANLGYVTSVANSGHIRANFEISTGKWYWEYTVSSGNQVDLHGVCKTNVASNSYAWNEIGSVGYFANDGRKYVSGVNSAYGATFTNGDVIGTALDKDSGTITFYKNGVSQGSIALPTSDTLVPYFADGSSGAATSGDVNFGQRSFAYTPPSGFKALCTANLPIPAIKKPSDHFNVQLSTGANIKTDSEALFTNELEWIKDRANANNHQLIDSVRGSNAVLQSNTTAAETTYTAPSGSSVGWVWRASNSASVTNNAGSISSQVSANVAAGFSIVTYTGTGVNATVGHGLGIAPQLVIIKKRVAGSGDVWVVGHGSLASWANYLILNTTAGSTSAGTIFQSTAPSNTVTTIGTDSAVNESGKPFVMYCFAEIAGYSKFGSYTGNGSADGPFVFTGFRPRFVMIKRTDAAENWQIYDTSRNTSNVVGEYLLPNSAIAGATITVLDILSNGFKIRVDSTNPGVNTSSGTYIFMAFAENPTKYSLAR